MRLANYSVNNLNQYTSRDLPGAAEDAGRADTSAWVWINGMEPVRQGDSYWIEFLLDNLSSGVSTNLQTLTIDQTGTNTVDQVQFLPQTPEEFQYDLDGNLVQDARWIYQWDSENRLIHMESLPAVPVELRLSIHIAYDWQGHRIAKIVTHNGLEVANSLFAYDGWNLIHEVDSVSGIQKQYVWGLDLSQSLQGAGGVGGLLWMSLSTNSSQALYAPQYDGNGNVLSIVSLEDATLSAQYEYGPFGEIVRSSGTMARVNPFRFSTKYQEDESDLLYYGYRYYNPSTGRWPNRDPLGDEAFRLRFAADEELPFEEFNLYSFVRNVPSDRTDLLGLFSNFIDCDCCQVEALKKDEGVAQAHIASLKESIQAVLPDILANPTKYPYRTGYKFNTALTRLDKASAKLKSATVVCSKASSPIASADWYGKKMWVYEPYWHYTDFAQGAHLVHEGTHMGSGTTDAAYFWQNRVAPRDTFFVPWNSIASTYDSWIIDGFCIPGYNCPKGTLPPIPHIYRSGKECP